MLREFLSSNFPFANKTAWEIIADLENLIRELQKNLTQDYEIKDEIAIHKTAIIDKTAIIKAPAIISANSFIGANSFLRNGVFLATNARIGISCEIKTSIILEHSAIAHFNFVGDSIIGQGVNMEAGAIRLFVIITTKEKIKGFLLILMAKEFLQDLINLELW